MHGFITSFNACRYNQTTCIFTMVYLPPVLSQVKAFLPRLEEADRELQKRLQGKGEGLDIEEVEEGEPCIEMVGV